MTYLKRIIRNLNKYFMDKKLKTNIFKILLQVAFQKIL